MHTIWAAKEKHVKRQSPAGASEGGRRGRQSSFALLKRAEKRAQAVSIY